MTTNQQHVFDALSQYGPLPDHALVPLIQHVVQAHQSSSGVRSRRAELTARGRVAAVGSVKMPSGRHAAIWAVKR